jgi:hypothetical protein
MNPDYTMRELTEEEFKPFIDKYRNSVFEDVHSYDFRDVLSNAELEQIRELGKGTGHPYKLHLGVFEKDNTCVGWSWGYQENALTFYMVNSAILKGHRRKGLYGALLNRCIEILSAKGFQLIYSRHCATNNAVIIPKLKAGFIISKMEIDDRFGVLIHLHYYTNSDRRRIMDYRAGQLRPNPKIKEAFKIP